MPSGYGSQYLALKYLNANVEHYKICEWAVKSIQAYNDLHIQDYNNYSENLSDDEVLDYLVESGVSINYNEPATRNQLKRQNYRKIYNNIIATNNLVNIQNAKGKDFEIINKNKYEYIMTYSFPCITKDSLILTENGYIPIEKIKVGDYVLTKSNTWQKVAKKFDNGIHQTCYMQGMGFENIHCTLNHKFYVREKYREWDNSKRMYIRKFKSPEFKECKDLTTSDYLGVPVIKDEKEFYTNDLDFWYMIGMYLGDGWLSKTGYDINIACNDKKLELLKKHLHIEKYKYTYNAVGNCYKLRFANKEIFGFIKKYIGTGCENKHIPNEILCLPKKQLEMVYQGYLDSDGCSIGNIRQFTSINRELIYSFSLIINKLFKAPTKIYKVKVSPKKIIENRIVNQKDWYQLRFKTTIDKQDKAFYEDEYIWYPFQKIIMAEKEHVYNMEVENDHSYILQGCISKNCQDLSLAGKRAGMNDTSTRSGMLWEVERILNELKEINQLPQILLMENVPQVHGIDNVEHFNKWQLALENMGYKNYFQDLIATDYGIPQTRNRCFMVSILGEYSYIFPKPIPLELKLKDMLEVEVDEKYYLSDKQINDIQSWNAYEKPLENMEKTDKNNISPTITTRSGAYAAGMILIKNANSKGYLEATDGDGIDISSRMEHHRGTVQKDKIQTLTTSGGNDRGVCIGTYQYSKSDKFMNGKDRLQLGKEVSDTLQTTQKEGVVTIGNYSAPTVMENHGTITAIQSNGLRIRKLTPRETGRLMGVKDEDIDKILKNQSNSSAFHLFGDSICTSCLMALFSQLLDISWDDKLWNIKNSTKTENI